MLRCALHDVLFAPISSPHKYHLLPFFPALFQLLAHGFHALIEAVGVVVDTGHVQLFERVHEVVGVVEAGAGGQLHKGHFRPQQREQAVAIAIFDSFGSRYKAAHQLSPVAINKRTTIDRKGAAACPAP